MGEEQEGHPNNNDNLFEINRRALMESYNAQSVTHGTYLLALIGAFLAIFPQWENIYKLRYGNWIFSTIIAVIVGGGLYLILRTFFWAYLSSDILSVTEFSLVSNTAGPQIKRIQSTVLAHFNQDSYLKPVAYCIGNSSSIWKKGLFVLLLIAVSFAIIVGMSWLLS